MTKDEMVDAYLAGVGAVRKAVAGLSREQLLARPVAGKWSTLETVCHLADFEPILADRMKRVIALDEPDLLPGDPGLFAARLAYDRRDVDEELAFLELTRRQMARILRVRRSRAVLPQQGDLLQQASLAVFIEMNDQAHLHFRRRRPQCRPRRPHPSAAAGLEQLSESSPDGLRRTHRP